MYDTRTVLILTGARDWDRAHKAFTKNTEPGGKPVKESDYHMGKFFCWRTEQLAEGAELLSLMELLGRLGDEPRSLIVPGQPMPWLVPGELIHRRKAFIDAPLVVQNLLIDIDGWATDIAWWERPEKLALAVHTGMIQRGLDYLTTQPMLIMLSQSAWPGHELKCHVHIWLQKPIKLDDLRRWAKVVNARLGGSPGLDPIVYGQVHINYTAKRSCNQFPDPIPESLRLTLHPPDELTLTTELPHEGIVRELGEAPATITSSELPDLLPSGDGWDMLKLSGTKGMINEYGYRAAAKIVKAEGRAAVEANIEALATKMHAIAWSVIAKNSDGERGDEDDAQTYTVQRYQQYLYSACEATIGDDLDAHLKQLDVALTEGATALFSTASIDAAAKLYRGWIGHYQDFRSRLIKARRVRAKDYDAAVEARVRELDKRRRADAREVDDALDALDGVPGLVGQVLDEDGRLLELPFYNKIAETYDWVGDGQNVLFIDRLDHEAQHRGGYRVTDQARIVGEFNIRGMEILNSVAPTLSLPQGCRSNVASLIDRKMKETANENGTVPSQQWGYRDICSRYKCEADVLWVNLGLEDGSYNCMRCTREGVKRMTWRQALKYPDAPIWTGNTVPLRAGANDPNSLKDFRVCDEGLALMDEGQWARDLFKIVKLASSDDEIHILAWLVSVILNWDTRFILQLRGEQGVGKSTTADMLCSLVDPISSVDPLKKQQNRRLPVDILSDDQKVMRNLQGREVAVIDNVESLTGRQQDRLCMIATGLGITERILYTHLTHETSVRCSLILSGIKESDTRPDFGDRVFTVTVRGGDFVDIHAAFDDIRGQVFDGLLRLAMLVKRMLDEGYGYDRKAIVDAVGKVYFGTRGRIVLSTNRAVAAMVRVENDAFASTFTAWLQHDDKHWGPGGIFEGEWVNSSDLLEAYENWYSAALGDIFVVNCSLPRQLFRTRIGFDRNSKKKPCPTSSSHLSRQLTKWATDISDATKIITFSSRILDGAMLRKVDTFDRNVEIVDEFLV